MLIVPTETITIAGSSRFFVASPQSTATPPVPAAPLFAFVKIVCLTTNTVIRAETANTITGLTVPITVTDEENQMVDIANTKEKRRVLLRVTFGVGDEFTDYADFIVTRADLDPNNPDFVV